MGSGRDQELMIFDSVSHSVTTDETVFPGTVPPVPSGHHYFPCIFGSPGDSILKAVWKVVPYRVHTNFFPDVVPDVVPVE